MNRDFLYSLFFTKDDDLDLTQVYFGIMVMFFIVAFTLTGLGIFTVSVSAWSVFASVFGILAITGTPKWVATLVANAKMPGEIARSVASGNDPGVTTDIQEIRQRIHEKGNPE
jgi:hypothetical protein